METERERFSESCRELGVFPSDRIAVAFSGGPDSVYLARMCTGYFNPENIVLLYVNYHDSEWVDTEERIVRDTADDLGLRLLVLNEDLDSKEKGFEERARRIRYTWFSSVVDSENLKGVLVAHQRNDDAETYLLQKERGIVSYPGIRSRVKIFGVEVYRPLLRESRFSIVGYLKKRGISYFDDPTNYNPERRRDAYRMGTLSDEREIDAVLKERDSLLPNFLEQLNRVSSLLPSDSFDLDSYSELDERGKRRLLYICIDQILEGISQERKLGGVDRCFQRLKSRRSSVERLIDGTYMYTDYRCFFFSRESTDKGDYEYRIEGPGNHALGNIRLSIDSPSQVGASSFPLFIRPASRDTPIGTRIEFRTAGSLMKKHRTPSWIKDMYPGIFDADGRLVYVPMWDEMEESPLKVEISRIKIEKPED